MFAASWHIGEKKMGSQALTLVCTIDAVNRHINGTATMYYDYPGPKFQSNVHGTYSLTNAGNGMAIEATITGHKVTPAPPWGGVPAGSTPNLQLKLVLAPDWQTGNASYVYLEEDGAWHEMDNQPVSQEEINPPGAVGAAAP